MDAFGRPVAATVNLVEVYPSDRGELVVTLESGPHLWQLSCHGDDLTTFRQFQARVADALGLWIDHDSRSKPLASMRRDYWQHAVATAFAKGSS